MADNLIIADAPIGALWKKTTKKGEILSGNIEVDGKKIKIVIWPNGFKKTNQPDYRIFIDTYVPKPKESNERIDDLPF